MEITKECIFVALRDVIDPELGINIVDLGLVYDVQVSDAQVCISMTMTTPACPLHSYLNQAAQEAICRHIREVKSVKVDLVWEPPWHPTMMSFEAKHQLGWQMLNNFSLGGSRNEPRS